MVRLKKTYTSFICYLLLVAFISVTTRNISDPAFRHEKTEFSPCKSSLTQYISVFSEEEEEDANEFDQRLILSKILFSHNNHSSLSTTDNVSCSFGSPGNCLSCGTSLFIRIRTLRI
jgi:hypothetical protein